MSYIGNPINSVAFLTDTFSGNGSTTAFTMSVAPATTSSVLVAVSGVLQDPSTYSVVGTTLTFSAAPPSGTGNVSVRYLGIPAAGVTTTAYRTVTDNTATAGQATFSIPSYTVGYLNVFQNGVRLGAADFTATNGTTVVLAVGAAAGDLITTESFYVSSVLNAIPATAGAVQQTYLAPNVAGNGPAFSAYVLSTQYPSSSTWTKITLTGEEFDTNNNFDKDTNYRFQPTVAGYYQINAEVYFNGGAVLTDVRAAIYKNGNVFKQGTLSFGTGTWNNSFVTLSNIVYMNGSTDYLELYGYNICASSPQFVGGSGYTNFSGALVRAA
jgi:hypothetical protein